MKMKKLRRQYQNTMNVIDKYIMQGYQDLKLHDVAFECGADETFNQYCMDRYELFREDLYNLDLTTHQIGRSSSFTVSPYDTDIFENDRKNVLENCMVHCANINGYLDYIILDYLHGDIKHNVMIQEIEDYPFDTNEVLERSYTSLIEIENDVKKAIEMNNNIALFKKYQVEDYKGYMESCLELEYIV